MPKASCPECGGLLRYDVRHKIYICDSCGLTMTREEYFVLKQEIREALRKEYQDLDKWKRDYLKWWLSSKKEE